jgi:hypothetical protein
MLAGTLIITLGFWSLFYSVMVGAPVIVLGIALFLWDMGKILREKDVKQESLEEFFDRQDRENEKDL